MQHLQSIIERSSFILLLSMSLNLQAKQDLQQNLITSNYGLTFVSSSKLKQLVTHNPKYAMLSGICNGGLYFITLPYSANLAVSHKELHFLYNILAAHNPIFYGLVWNSVLYTINELVSVLKVNLFYNKLYIQTHLISYFYGIVCFYLLQRNYSSPTQYLLEESYVYY